MAHDWLWLLHSRAADLCAHSPLLHGLTWGHLYLRRKRVGHGI